MPTTSKPRKKYKPKPQLTNPLGYVLEGMETVRSRADHMLKFKIKNSAALLALMRGNATKQDMNILVAVSNMTETLCSMGFGKEYSAVAVDGREAILKIVFRAVDKLKFVPTGPEITAVRELVELHEQQMGVITIAEMDKAIALADKQLRAKKNVIRLPEINGVPDAG